MNKLTFSLLLLMGFLVSCGNPTALNYDGSPNGELKWPKIKDVRLDNRLGFEMNQDSLKALRPGLTRDNLYYLLGRPHFSEGFRVREWNYLVYFSKGGQRQSCILKVLFDKDKIAQHYYWHPIEPESGICPPAGLYSAYYVLDAPMLFAFDGAEYGDLSSEGQYHLYQIVQKIKARDEVPSRLEVVGYSDILGNADYNQRLSQKRAQTVYNYLQAQGVQAEQVVVVGFGSENSRVDCDYLQGDKRSKIACLAPNRRVELKVLD